MGTSLILYELNTTGDRRFGNALFIFIINESESTGKEYKLSIYASLQVQLLSYSIYFSSGLSVSLNIESNTFVLKVTHYKNG
jgi:hypothetical protein